MPEGTYDNEPIIDKNSATNQKFAYTLDIPPNFTLSN